MCYRGQSLESKSKQVKLLDQKISRLKSRDECWNSTGRKLKVHRMRNNRWCVHFNLGLWVLAIWMLIDLRCNALGDRSISTTPLRLLPKKSSETVLQCTSSIICVVRYTLYAIRTRVVAIFVIWLFFSNIQENPEKKFKYSWIPHSK